VRDGYLLNDGFPETCQTGRGVRQGCCLSPLLYITYDEVMMKEACFMNHCDLKTCSLVSKKDGVAKDAIYTLRGIVCHINTNGSTAMLCALDISKAFDKMSHRALYIKLIQRNIPKCFLNVLINWYSKSYAFVRWGTFVSRVFLISAGVRQGGVLSPALFAVFMDSMICKLRAAGYGANIFVNQ